MGRSHGLCWGGCSLPDIPSVGGQDRTCPIVHIYTQPTALQQAPSISPKSLPGHNTIFFHYLTTNGRLSPPKNLREHCKEQIVALGGLFCGHPQKRYNQGYINIYTTFMSLQGLLLKEPNYFLFILN